MKKNYTRDHFPTGKWRKILLIMRLKLVIMLCSMGTLTASPSFSQLKRMDVSYNKAALVTVLEDLIVRSGYQFLFYDQALPHDVEITMSRNNVTVAEILNEILPKNGLSFQMKDDVIIISPAKSLVSQQPTVLRTITGRVTDAAGAPASGVSILVKGSTRGTITDADGRYRIQVGAGDAVLEFTFVGMRKQSVTIGDRTGIDVTLAEQPSPINDVQVIAYGTTSRKLNTGSVTTIKKEDIEMQPVANLLNALQGRVNGMYIEPRSSLPGSNPKVEIRGRGTLRDNSSAPLFVLDGIPIPDRQTALNFSIIQSLNELSTMLNINPMDVESVDVLKDADAAALYGSRGANGVILITTKKGRAGKTSVNVNAQTGFGKMPHFLDMWDIDRYVAAREEALANDGITPTQTNAADLLLWDRTKTHDWQEEFLGGKAKTNSVNVSVSGGNSYTNFYINAGHRTEETVMPGGKSLIDKSVRMNMNHSSADRKFNVSATAGVGQYKILLPTTSLIEYYNLPPHYPIYKDDGTPNWSAGRSYPLAYLLQPYNVTSNSYNARGEMSYEVIEGLKLKISGGVNSMVTAQEQKTPLISQNPAYSPTASMNTRDNNNYGWIMEPQMTYDRQVKKHRISFLLGGTWERSQANDVGIRGEGFTNDAMMTTVTAASKVTTTKNFSEYAYASLFSRLTYHYAERYLLNLSYRRDGSSRFGPERKFGDFGAVGAAWIFSSENFIKENIPFLSFGKLRGSYGILGNDKIGDFQYISTYNTNSGGGWAYDGTSLTPAGVSNPELRWEENRKLDIGIELGLLNDRIWASASWFRNRTGNQLVNYTLSIQSGFGGYMRNFPAVVQNTGWEFELSTRNVDTDDFKWTTRLNFSWSDNKLLEFPGIESTSYATTYIVGESLNFIRGYEYGGLDENGLPIRVDRDKSGGITEQGDKYILGDPDPKFGGMTNTFTYKNLEFSCFFQFNRRFGMNTMLTTHMYGPARNATNYNDYWANRWQKPGDEATAQFPRFTTNNTKYNFNATYRQSDINYETTNTVRLTNLSLRYTLPRQWTSRVKIERLQFYVLGQNIYTWDKLKKYRFDPETGITTMPPLRTWTFGINCTF